MNDEQLQILIDTCDDLGNVADFVCKASSSIDAGEMQHDPYAFQNARLHLNTSKNWINQMIKKLRLLVQAEDKLRSSSEPVETQSDDRPAHLHSQDECIVGSPLYQCVPVSDEVLQGNLGS